MMSRISRYAFREMAGPTVLGLLVYGAVLLMNLMREAAELFIRRNLGLPLVTEYLLFSMPRIFVLAMPMAVLLGVLIGIGRMYSDNEITALRSCGLSAKRLLAPVAVLGLLGSIASALLFNIAVPSANYAQHRLNAQIFLSSDINREIHPRVFYERIPGMLIYADEAEPADGTLSRVLIYQKSSSGQEELSLAGTARMDQQPNTGSIQFELADVVSHAWTTTNPDLYQISRSTSQMIDRPPDLVMQEMIRSLAAPPPRNLREQTVTELLRTLEELEAVPGLRGVRRQVNEARVELHKKFSLPLTPLAFAILGLPLALGHRQSSRMWGFAVSILIIILAYAMLTAGEQLADRNVISPAVAMWSGNVFFALVGLLLLFTGSRIDLRLFFWRPAATPREHAAAAGQDVGKRLNLPSPRPGQRQFPSLLDRYLLRHLITLSFFVALSLVVLFSLFFIVNLIDDLTHSDVQLTILFPYLMYLQPQIVFAYVAPISLCIGTLLSFALLARTNELTAIRAGGVGLFRVATPFVLTGTFVGLLSFAAHDSVLPHTNENASRIRDEIRKSSPRSYRQPRRWVFGSQGSLVNFSDFQSGANEFRDLAVISFSPRGFDIQERVFAARATWDNGGWTLHDGWLRKFRPGSEEYNSFTSLRYQELDPPGYFSQDWKAPDQMSYRELSAYVGDLEQRGYDTRELRVGLYRKVAIPFVCVVMVLIGLPFALRVEHRGPVFAIAFSILLAFVYFGILQAFGKLGEVARLPAVLAAWAPNLFFSGLGLYLTATARW